MTSSTTAELDAIRLDIQKLLLLEPLDKVLTLSDSRTTSL